MRIFLILLLSQYLAIEVKSQDIVRSNVVNPDDNGYADGLSVGALKPVPSIDVGISTPVSAAPLIDRAPPIRSNFSDKDRKVPDNDVLPIGALASDNVSGSDFNDSYKDILKDLNKDSQIDTLRDNDVSNDSDGETASTGTSTEDLPGSIQFSLDAIIAPVKELSEVVADLKNEIQCLRELKKENVLPPSVPQVNNQGLMSTMMQMMMMQQMMMMMPYMNSMQQNRNVQNDYPLVMNSSLFQDGIIPRQYGGVLSRPFSGPFAQEASVINNFFGIGRSNPYRQILGESPIYSSPSYYPLSPVNSTGVNMPVINNTVNQGHGLMGRGNTSCFQF